MTYRSSIRAFDDFLGSLVWRDILQELEEWLKDVHDALEDPDGETEDKTLHRLGGNAQAIRRFILLPEIMRDNIKMDSEE